MGLLLQSNKCPSASKMCVWRADVTTVGRLAGAGAGRTRIGGGAVRSMRMADPMVGAGRSMPIRAGVGADRTSDMPAGGGVDHSMLTLDPVGAGAGPSTGMAVGVGVDPSTLTPDPVGAGAGRSTDMPAGAGVGRFMPMPEHPIGVGVDRSTQPHSPLALASIPGTAAASILGMPAAPTTPLSAGIRAGEDGAGRATAIGDRSA